VPRLDTPRFGIIDYPDDAVIHFPAGLPAFESDTEFLAVERSDAAPLIFLQSVHHPSLCFLTMPVLDILPGYRLALCPEDLRLLGLPPGQQPEISGDLVCICILTVPEHGQATANLLAPVVIRRDTRAGVQAVQMDSAHSHRHPLFAGEVSICS
jgi:flagellar assembly factor FliW